MVLTSFLPAFSALLASVLSTLASGLSEARAPLTTPTLPRAATCQSATSPFFVVFGGGGAPSYNEIALEKNVLYFRRTLTQMGYSPDRAAVFFANGNSGEATVRYINPRGKQQFKVPQIPNLAGASTPENLRRQLTQLSQQMSSGDHLFFYFTGHGGLNRQDQDNNTLLLWKDKTMSVRQFTRLLDQLPQETTVVTMMAQCYSGSFANLIYEGGDADRAVAPQNRCGFFATIKSLPSVGCTPAVNEADYRDYSSSFFAGLSGRSRVGQPVASADYNRDGIVSYSEAHAFAKVDEETTDLPISTSEAWLQNHLSEAEQQRALDQPIAQILSSARPEQRYVVEALVRKFKLNGRNSFFANVEKLNPTQFRNQENQAYMIRLQMELLNIVAEKRLRQTGKPDKVAILDRVLKCEQTSWKKPSSPKP